MNLNPILPLLRRHVPRDGAPRRLWRALRARWVLRRFAGPAFIRAFRNVFPAATFVQIGSNDGTQQDPLHDAILRGTWRGVMVEPVPYVFRRLQHNFGHLPTVRLENVAVADVEGKLPFYHLPETAEPGLPPWYDALGSFSRDVLLRHVDYIPDIAERIVCSQVPCVTFAHLCERNDIHELDLLHLDTEGHDYAILKQVDLARWRPRLIIYEHHHLAPTGRASCRERLSGMGYDLLEEGLDTWCVDTGPRMPASLLRHWRRLKSRSLRHYGRA